MACESDIPVGAQGVQLELEVLENCLTTAFDISSPNAIAITVERPDGSTFTRAATLTTDGTDGKMFILTVTGDITVKGTYKMQGSVNLPSGLDTPTTIGTFDAFENLG
jgi:hypothetical protein